MKNRLKHILLFFFTLGLLASAAGQNVFSSEEELKKRANQLFEDEQYEEAQPLFSQLLSLYPKDPNYNYKFGVCLLYSSSDKEKAISYLESASKDPKADVEVFYFLGRAYHLNYRFNEAIAAFNSFRSRASSRQKEKLDVNRQIEMCENGKKLLRNITDLIVLDRKNLAQADFFRSYDLSGFSAKLVVKPDDLKTSYDKKKKDNSVMYVQQGGGEIYFSSYGDNSKNGRDIFITRRLPNGEWSKAQPVGYPINTQYDEDYPFLHPNGKILYFCSKGHNSMGGYDVFKSTRNEITGSWGEPVNMDFAINTPDDDILFVSDSSDKTAYFSSKRASETGSITVYKIRLERKPLDVCLLKGRVINESGDKVPAAKITVQDLDKKEVVGVFNSNETTGDYLMNLPNGGKFVFVVEGKGYKELSDLVIVPVQYELKPLAQEITLKKEDGKDKLTITNNFDAPVDDDAYNAAMAFIRNRAKLDVTPTEEVLSINVDDSTTASREKTEDKKNLTNKDIIEMAYADAKGAQKDARDMKKNADAAYYYANLKNEQAESKKKESEAILASVDTMKNQMNKLNEIDKASRLRKESDELSKETVVAYNLAKALEEQSQVKQQDADASLRYAKDLEGAINSGSNKEALVKLNEQKDALEKNIAQNRKTSGSASEEMVKKSEDKQKEADKMTDKYNALGKEVADLSAESNRLRNEAKGAKDKTLKDNLTRQAEETENELASKQKEADLAKFKAAQLTEEASDLRNSANMASSVMNEIKTTQPNEATLAAVDKNKLEKQVEDYRVKEQQEKEKKTQEVLANNVTNTSNASVSANENNNSSDNTSSNTTSANTTTSAETIHANYNDRFTQKLKDADTIKAESGKEAAKANIYNEWKSSIVSESAGLKSSLKTIKDKEEKKKAEQKIKYLDALAVEKQKESESSAKRSQDARQKEALVANNTSSSVSNAAGTNNSSSSGTNNSSVTTENTSTNNAANTSSENTLTASNSSSRDGNTTASNTNATTTSANNNSTKDGNTAATSNTSNTTAENKTPVTGNAGFDLQMKETESLADGPEKETKKADIYREWNKTITDSVTALKDKFAKTKSKKEKKMIEDKIRGMEADAQQKEMLAEQSDARADKLKKEKETTASGNTASNSVTANNSSGTSAQLTDGKAEFEKNDKELQNLSKQAAKDESDQVAVAGLMQEDSRRLHIESIKARDEGSNEKADELEQKAVEKQKQAKDIYAKLNYKVKEETLASNVSNANNISSGNNNAISPATNTNSTASNNNTGNNSSTAANTTNAGSTGNEIKTSDNNTTANNNASTINTNTSGTAANNTEASTTTPASNTSQPSEQLKLTKEYKKYEALRIETDSLSNKAKEQYRQSDELKLASENKSADARKLIDRSDSVTDPAQKVELLEKSKALNQEARNDMVRSDSIKTAAKSSDASAASKKMDLTVYLNSLDKNTSQSLAALDNSSSNTLLSSASNTTTTSETSSLQPDMNKTNLAASSLVDKIEIVNRPIYSKEKPIPVNEKLPEGLIFKVQVGAFRNPIPQDLFKGITPITGETTNAGLTRYTAGIFTKFDAADRAKNQVRGYGYKDAFVVAFLNGKRIPMSQALTPNAKENAVAVNASKTDNLPANNNAETKTSDTNAQNNSSTGQNNPANTVQPQVSTETKVRTFDTKTISGLFYTVQVGVFSKTVTAAQLYNIEPLNSEKLENGLFRYTSGVYNDVNKAAEARGRIVGLGVKDAFVTAYYNGKRITVDEAKKLAAGKGSEPAPSATENPVKQPEVKTTEPEVKTSEPVPNPTATTTEPAVKENTPASTTQPGDGKVVFSVQLGAFKQEVPIDMANKMVKAARSGGGVTTVKNPNGVTLYLTGKFEKYEDAEKLKNEIVNGGLEDAFVVAFKDGKKIFIDEALQK